MNLNSKQLLGIAVVVVSVLAISTTQLTDLFGPDAAKKVVAAAIMLNGIFGGIIATIGGDLTQGQQVKQVLAMPGVEKLDVNGKASPALAALAVDPNVNKIAPTPAAQSAVERIAATGEPT